MLVALTKKISGWSHTRVTDVLYDLSVPDYTSTDTAHGCRPLTFADSSLLLANFKPETTTEFLTRLADSTGIISLSEGGIIAGYAWATSETRDHEGDDPFYYRIVPGPGDLYVFDVFVRPEFRGQGIATNLMHAVATLAVTRGFRRCFTLHDARNSAMIKVSEKIGFRRIGTLNYKRIGPWVTRDTQALGRRGG